MRAATSLVLALALAGCTGENASRPATHDDLRDAARALIAFARAPSERTWSAIPFEPRVELGLANRIHVRRARRELSDEAAWRLEQPLFRGRTGTYSALELIAGEQGPVRISVGPHRHCVSPSVSAPRRVAALRRVAVQPREFDSCLAWWTVDVFVSDKGRIRAVTVDLWEP